jgi:oligogalacturonide lyase
VSQSRRFFVSLLPAAALGFGAEKGPLPSEAVRYSDPATESLVYRLTDPKFSSLLPPNYGRAISRRGNFLYYSSDRDGSFQLYRMELKTGQSVQLTEAGMLEPWSITLLQDEKSCCYIAGGALNQLQLARVRERVVYRISEGFEAAPGLAVSEDGLYAAIVERKAGLGRLRLINLLKGTATTVVEGSDEIADPMIRPRRAGVMYRLGGRELHVVNFDGQQNQRLRVANGGLGTALWSSDGRTVLYLNFPEDRKQLNSIREYTPDTNEDRLVAATTQYVQFGRNVDSTVFVGASGSKASPYLLLLVRSVKRELTLCEHKASDPRLVAPVFSPNSQKVFFQSDRHGKWAIYSMAVDRFVAETE